MTNSADPDKTARYDNSAVIHTYIHTYIHYGKLFEIIRSSTHTQIWFES